MSNSLIDTLNIYGTVDNSVSLKGRLNDDKLKGVISDRDKLIGTIESNLSVIGSIGTSNNLVAYIQGNTITYPIYDGEYIVTPRVTEQLLETKNKVTKDDITVKEIPYHEASNEYGYTATIG